MEIRYIKDKQLFCRCGDFIYQNDRQRYKPIYYRLGNTAVIVQNPTNSYAPGTHTTLPTYAFVDTNIIRFSQCKICKYGLRQVLGKCKRKYEHEQFIHRM